MGLVPPTTLAASAAASAASVAATVTARPTRGPFASFVHHNLSAVEFGVIHFFDRFISGCFVYKSYEAKASRTTGLAISNHNDFLNFAKTFERSANARLVCGPREAADK